MASARAGGSDIRAQLIESRCEGCPVRMGGETVYARPCIAFEIGEIETSGTGETGRSDAGVWSTAGAGLRLSWVAASALLVEAQLFGTVPLKRYELVSGEPPSVLYRTALLGLNGAIGAAFQLP